MPRWSFPAGFRIRRPLLILFASIGLTAIAVIDAQFAVRSHQEVATRALREYATFAAWSYAQHLTMSLGNLAREALGAVNHGDNLHTSPRIPTARELAHYLPWDANCLCHAARFGPNPDTFFALKIGSDSLDVAVNAHPEASRGWEVDRPLPVPLPVTTPGDYSRSERRRIVDTLTLRIRAEAGPDHGYTMLLASIDSAAGILTYTLMPTSWGDTMVYGARYSRTALAGVMQSALDGNGLLPATFTAGRRNRDVLAIRVRDAEGNNLFDSAPGVASPLNAHIELPTRLGRMSVDAIIRPELAGTFIIGGLPASRLPFLLGLLALAATLSVISVMQLRREGELARLRADFVSSVSHELRTPLAQIRLYVETLRLGRANTSEQRDWSLAHIERETTRLANLVENSLRFSRIGRADLLPPEPTDVGVELTRIVNEFRPLALSRQANIELDVSVTSPAMLRPDALRHVVNNLLDNAVKYGPSGQTVFVSARELDGELHLAVRDQGSGVPPRERETIWQPFLRGTTAKGHGGSGIGLTVVRDVAGQHGGRAYFDADHEGGARFCVILPMNEPPAGANA